MIAAPEASAPASTVAVSSISSCQSSPSGSLFAITRSTGSPAVRASSWPLGPRSVMRCSSVTPSPAPNSWMFTWTRTRPSVGWKLKTRISWNVVELPETACAGAPSSSIATESVPSTNSLWWSKVTSPEGIV